MTQPPSTPVMADPNITGPCSVPVSFVCEGTGFQRLNPLAMLPNSRVPNEYGCICQPCFDQLSSLYLLGRHR